jgi:hypothetical protein
VLVLVSLALGSARTSAATTGWTARQIRVSVNACTEGFMRALQSNGQITVANRTAVRSVLRATCVCFVNWAKARLSFDQCLGLAGNSPYRTRAGRAMAVCTTARREAMKAALAKR